MLFVLFICICFRYEDKLKTSKQVGIKKGITSGISGGVLWFITYSCYAVAFSYGVRLIIWSRTEGNSDYTPGVLIIVRSTILYFSAELDLV